MHLGVETSSSFILVSIVNYSEKLFLLSLGRLLSFLYEFLLLLLRGVLFSSAESSLKTSCSSVIALLYNSGNVWHLISGLANALAKMTIEVGLPDSCLNRSWYERASTSLRGDFRRMSIFLRKSSVS